MSIFVLEHYLRIIFVKTHSSEYITVHCNWLEHRQINILMHFYTPINKILHFFGLVFSFMILPEFIGRCVGWLLISLCSRWVCMEFITLWVIKNTLRNKTQMQSPCFKHHCSLGKLKASHAFMCTFTTIQLFGSDFWLNLPLCTVLSSSHPEMCQVRSTALSLHWCYHHWLELHPNTEGSRIFTGHFYWRQLSKQTTTTFLPQQSSRQSK